MLQIPVMPAMEVKASPRGADAKSGSGQSRNGFSDAIKAAQQESNAAETAKTEQPGRKPPENEGGSKPTQAGLEEKPETLPQTPQIQAPQEQQPPQEVQEVQEPQESQEPQTPQEDVEETAAVIIPIVASAPQEADPESAPAEEKVVSILEGKNQNREMEPLPKQETEAPKETPPESRAATQQREEATARMPQQQTGPAEKTEQQQGKAETVLTAEKAASDPCPLENENDAEQNAKNKEQKPNEAAPDAKTLPIRQTVDISPERVAGAQQMASATSGTEPVRMENLFERMVEQITQAGNANELEIQLKPEFLGKVSILLALTQEGLRARIQVEDPSVRGMVNGQLTQLIDSLSEKGIKVASIDVSEPQVTDQAFSQSKSDAQQEQPKGRSKAPLRIDAAPELAVVAYTPIWGDALPGEMAEAVSSVEYRA